MLMIEDDEDLPEDSDPNDALSEIANMVAGEVKKCRFDQKEKMKVGIPIVLSGSIKCNCCDGQKMANSEMLIGPARVQITVLYPYKPKS